MKGPFLRIPKWGLVGWNEVSNPLKSRKNQILVLMTNIKIGIKASKVVSVA